jgi:DNA uptake protein ComE-like DNA-binding protein
MLTGTVHQTCCCPSSLSNYSEVFVVPSEQEIMRTTVLLSITAALVAGSIACSNDPNTTRQQAASATEQLKRDSREAAGNIKKGAATARTDLTAAAQGVKEGLNDKSSSELNLNDANKAQLMGLPGIDEPRANAIIADRPYRRAHDVVSKGAISEAEYQKISTHVTAGSTSSQ